LELQARLKKDGKKRMGKRAASHVVSPSRLQLQSSVGAKRLEMIGQANDTNKQGLLHQYMGTLESKIEAEEKLVDMQNNIMAKNSDKTTNIDSNLQQAAVEHVSPPPSSK